MKSRQTISFILCVVLLVSLSACGNVGSEVIGETVSPIFTSPPNSQEDLPATEFAVENRTTVSSGSGKFGPSADALQDKAGRYYLYTGGEMKASYDINMSGTILEYGVGIYLFLDGRPQPYKLSEDGEYSYMHIIYPSRGEDCTVDFYFTPVTGQKGDELQFYPMFVLYPDYTPWNDEGTVTMDDGPLSIMAVGPRIKFEATPIAMELPEVENLLVSAEISYTDVSSDEIRGWTDTDLQTKIAYKMYLDGTTYTERDAFIPENGKVDVRFEVWGAPDLEYGVIIMVNNQLVSAAEEDMIFIGLESGKKTVVEVTLELPDYEALGGYSTVFALLVPRNFDYTAHHGICGFWPNPEHYFHLYEDRFGTKKQ